MAKSGYTDVTVTKYDTLRFRWWEISQSVENNTTTVGWAMELIATNPGKISSSASKDWNVTVNGVNFSGTNKIGIGNNETKTLASDQVVISHNDDGTKAFSYSFSQKIGVNFNDSYIGTKQGSGTGELDTIPRKSSLTVANGELDKSHALSVKRHSTIFTHTITYECGGASGTVVEKSSATSISWSPPLELASQEPQRNSVTITFTITTYHGDSVVGSNTAAAEFAIPDSVYPPIALTVSDPTGYAGYYGFHIQGQSSVQIDINTYGVYGAWIKSYKVEIDGKTYSTGEVNGNTITVKTDTLKGSGLIPITVTVVDSRDRPSHDSTDVIVLDYSYPQIKSLSAYRSDATGAAKADGSYLTVKFSSSIYELNELNGAWYKLEYKRSADSKYTEERIEAYTGQFVVTDGRYTFPVDGSSYDIVLTVGDRFKSVPRSTTGASLAKLFSLMKKAGKIVGVALGKIAEFEGVFDIAFKVKFSGGVDGLGDFVIEQGELNGWSYRKWNSGKGECWKTLVHNTAVNTQWGSVYMSSAIERQNYPFPFIGKPVENVTAQGNSPVWIMISSNGSGVNGAYASAVYHLCCPGSYASAEYYISYYCVGRWK